MPWVHVLDGEGVAHLIPLDDRFTHSVSRYCGCAPDFEPSDTRRGDVNYMLEHHVRYPARNGSVTARKPSWRRRLHRRGDVPETGSGSAKGR